MYGAPASIVIGGPVVGGTANRVLFIGSTGLLADSSDLTFDGSTFATPVIGSGAASGLSFTTSGGTQFQVGHVAAAVNFLQVNGGAVGQPVTIFAGGADTNIPVQFRTAGSGSISFQTAGGTPQFQISHTASATNRLSVSGSNGGNPSIAATGGQIALGSGLQFIADNLRDIGSTGASRPASIFVGTKIQIEANVGLKLTNQTDGAGAGAGTLGNAPTTGNPAFWLPVTINGTPHFIPAWT